MKHYLLSASNQNELTHFGVKGMKWGIRRYQNTDGTLTEAGKKRYKTVENLEKSQRRKRAVAKAALTIGKIAVGSVIGTFGLAALASVVNSNGPAIRAGFDVVDRILNSGMPVADAISGFSANRKAYEFGDMLIGRH